ncbi:aldo/keto reductase [Lignipirellula cremea]|uniref:General stress protein 69 n=1 Tax=Lignipirellula cremea TaxID=2528010 RepID=A0A518DUQ7_9BACT|nr:aldo/keto reductase [Lignipirellula cremea]QDU95554.1 General stress protein 69 [Lignipirellula cremea]
MTAFAPRQLGDTDIFVTPVALGCWPIAGMTSLHVNDADSLATLQAAVDHGVNFFDTAFSYGLNGESEKLIHRALGDRRDQIVIATKCGLGWDDQQQRLFDGRPAALRAHCEESLRRLATDRVDLLYLHAPDPNTPVAESAGELRRLLDEGKTRSVGVSNFTIAELEEFSRECPIAAHQPPYNMLMRSIDKDSIPWCQERKISVVPYWPLMKGLLAGRLERDHQFQPGDGRPKYPMFQGEEWERNQDLLDELRTLAGELGKTVADIVINWTMQQPGITSVLCGAKRPDQIQETAAAMQWKLDAAALQRIEDALIRRGPPIERWAV